jgi:hypothetical protein
MPPIDRDSHVSNSGGIRGIVSTQPVHAGRVTTGRGDLSRNAVSGLVCRTF